MRAVDPSIKLVASGSSNYGADWIGWNRTVLQTLRNHIDYIAIHTYIANRENDFERYLGGWQLTVDRYIETTAALIREVRTGPNPRPIYIAYDEWNVWYRTGNREKLEEIYNFEDALAMGVFFNSFFRHADVVKMANLAQMVNVIAPIMTNKDGFFLQPIYFPLVEFSRQRENTSLDVWVSSPAYKIQNRPQEIQYLDVSASHNRRTGELFVNVLNRSKDRDIATRVESQAAPLSGEVGRLGAESSGFEGDAHVRRRPEGSSGDQEHQGGRAGRWVHIYVSRAFADDPEGEGSRVGGLTMRFSADQLAYARSRQGYLDRAASIEFLKTMDIRMSVGHWSAGDFCDRFAPPGYHSDDPSFAAASRISAGARRRRASMRSRFTRASSKPR